MARPLVVLFDVDGTLITSGGAGRRALTRTFEERFGRDDAFEGVGFGGMTDRAIVRTGLRALGEPDGDREIEEILEFYLDVLADEVRQAQGYRLHVGVESMLDALHAEEDVAVGLGTGNIEDGARIKLTRVGVWERFGFGGYGSDDEDRGRLIRRGIERGAERLGVAPEAVRTVIVGDTPKDAAAAAANEAECLAVATGTFSEEQLRETSATMVCRSLAEPEALSMVLSR